MIKYLINYVELKTKVASFFPFIYTILIYVLFAYPNYNFNINLAIVFLIAILCLDMATTTLNHLVGMNKEDDISIYDQNLLNSMKQNNITYKFNYFITALLTFIGIACGIYLVLNSTILLLFVGMICVGVAIIYSYGPIPIKNTSLGEIASGITMGYLIPLSFFISQDSSIFIVNISYPTVIIDFRNILYFISIFLIPTLLISNIMLANNICDIEKDKNNDRYTLPVIIGQIKSINLWKIIYYLVYIDIIFLILTKIFPPILLISLISIIFVNENIKMFANNPIKSKTFISSIKNLVIILVTISLIILCLLIYTYII